MLNFDFWAHNPTKDESVDLWGDLLPVEGQPIATGERARDFNAHAIACLYSLRRDTDIARQYALAISDKDLKSSALKFIENPFVFDPIKGAIPLSEKASS
ncbi:MAG: hypothetical protein AB1611_17945 [bacterium]